MVIKYIKHYKGFTLIELMVTTVIVGIIGLVLSYYFVAEYRFRSMVRNDVDITTEARIATNHMVRILRFAKPSRIILRMPNLSVPYGHIEANIDGGHIELIPNDTTVWYKYDHEGEKLLFNKEGEPEQVITENVVIYDHAYSDGMLRLDFIFNKDDRHMSLRTSIRPIGEE